MEDYPRRHEGAVLLILLVAMLFRPARIGPVAMKKFITVLTAAGLAYFGLSVPAEAGRRSRSDVPPPVVIDRTVFTPVVSGL